MELDRLERAYWSATIRGEALSRFDSTTLTSGQLVWISINQEIDREERRRDTCSECRMKEDNPTTTTCRSCGKDFMRASAEDMGFSPEITAQLKEAAELARASNS